MLVFICTFTPGPWNVTGGCSGVSHLSRSSSSRFSETVMLTNQCPLLAIPYPPAIGKLHTDSMASELFVPIKMQELSPESCENLLEISKIDVSPFICTLYRPLFDHQHNLLISSILPIWWKVFELWCNQYAWQAAHLMLEDSCREEMEWFDQTCLVPGAHPPLYVTLFTLFSCYWLNQHD